MKYLANNSRVGLHSMLHSVVFSLLFMTAVALRLPHKSTDHPSNKTGQNATEHQNMVNLNSTAFSNHLASKKTGAAAAVQAFEEAFETKHKFFEDAMKHFQLNSAERNAQDNFKQFLKAHFRQYFHFGDKHEYRKRLGHFSDSLKIIKIRNDYEKNYSTHPNPATHGITKYADWSEAEFKAILGHKMGEVEVADDGKKANESWFGRTIKWIFGGNVVTQNHVSQVRFTGSCADIKAAYGCSAKLSDGRSMAQACPDECGHAPNAGPHNKYTNCAEIYAQAGCEAKLKSGEPMPLVCPVQCPPSESSSTSSKVPCDKNWASTVFVRNQGACGDCWAFAAVEAIRSAYINEHGTDPGKLSTQFLVDCFPEVVGKKCPSGVNGCCGSMPSRAFDWIATTGGIPTQAAYGDFFSLLENQTSLLQQGPVSNKGKGVTFSGNNPKTSFACKSGIPKEVALKGKPEKITGEDNMASHVCSTGTLAVAVDASTWSTYTGGVLTPLSCGTRVDHAVHAMGLDKKRNSWIIQNSWGEDYGVSVDGIGVPTDKYSNCLDYKERFGCDAQVKDGMTVGEFCPGSCSSTKSKGGFVMLAYGGNTCGIDSPYVYATPSTGRA